MPFIGSPQGGKNAQIQAALAIREQRLRESDNAQRNRIERIKAISAANIAAEKERREAAKFDLEMAKGQFELQGQLKESDQATAPLLDAANNTALPANQRQASADQAIREIEQNIRNRQALGQDTRSAALNVGGNAGSASATAAAEVSAEDQKDLTKRRRDEQAEVRKAEREEKIRQRAEEVTARKEIEKQQGLATIWKGTELDALAKAANEQIKTFNSEKQVKLVERFDFTSPTDILEAMTLYIKNTDDGAVVREGDIDLQRAIGASSLEDAFAKLSGIIDSGSTIPANLGAIIEKALKRQHEVMDELLVEAHADAEAYADRNEMTDAQRRRAVPNPGAVDRARKRIQGRQAAPQAPAPADGSDLDSAGAEAANAAAAKHYGIPIEEVTGPQAAAMFNLQLHAPRGAK